MTRNQAIQFGAIAVLVASLGGSSLLSGSINQQRKELQLAGLGTEGKEDLPPMEAISSAAMFTFRGLAVDALWYKANQDKEAGKFYDLNQKARLITSLQPRFPQVWSFQAWNMAYNISVMTHTRDERWDWVNKGIALLRDKGIPYNPRTIRLYRELAWIYFHKVGQFSDDMTWYYKERMAYEWQEILGQQAEGATKEQAVASFKLIADAPEFIEGKNGLVEKTPAVVPLLARLKEMGLTPDTALLKRIGRILMVTYSSDATRLGASIESLPNFSEADRQLAGIMADPAFAPGVEPLLSHLRKRVLIDNYHMKPAFMLGLMETYGPIDWRHPAAHGLYWSSLGVEMAKDLRNKKDLDLLNTYRGIIHACQELMYRGRVSYDPISHYVDLLPDPRFVEAYETAVEKSKTDLLNSGLYGVNTTENFDAGYENFLLYAITTNYLYGNEDKAKYYYARVREKFGDKPDNVARGRYLQTLQELVMTELQSTWDMQGKAREFCDALLSRAWNEGLMRNRMDVFNHFYDTAQKVYEKYSKGDVTSDLDQVQNRRSLGKSWEELVFSSYENMLKQPGVGPVLRSRLWANSPLNLRQRAYDAVKDPARREAMAAGIDPNKAFPEPEGMEAYRKLHPVVITEKSKINEGGPIQFEREK